MRKFLISLKRGILKLGVLAYRTETTDGLVLLLVFSAAWWMAAQQGGARAESLPGAMRLLLAALVIHGASLLIRPSEQARLSLVGLAFAPFVAWLAIDSAALAPDRGQALVAFSMALLLAASWHLVLHHSRRTWSHATSLALLAAPAAILACGAFDRDDSRIGGLLGAMPNPAFAGHFISAMGSPGACAAVLLLAVMPPLAIALNPGLKGWMRVIAAYFAALLLIGLVATHHGWAWIGFAGCLAVMLVMICESNKVRIGLAAFTAVAGWILAANAVTRVGVLQALRDDPAKSAWLGRAAVAAIRNHPLLGGGAGSFPLAFETTRPATWQTDPATCGSLPLQVLCEHGLIGAILLLLPVGWLAWRCLGHCLRRPNLTEREILDFGGHRRIALRRSLAIGSTMGVLGAGLVLVLDYPSSLPGVLLLIIATGAVSFRLCQDQESRVAPETSIRPMAFACLLLPALATPALVAQGQSAGIAAAARDTVRRFSPAGLVSPGLLDSEDQANLNAAASQLGLACRLNPLDADSRAWHAQALALLVRQSPQDELLQGRARSIAAEAVELNPRSPWAHAVLGSILLGANEPELRANGLAHMRTAAGLAPMNQAIALRLAQALGQAGASAADLRAAYERAALTNPKRAEVRDKLVLLKSAGGAGGTSR